MKHWLLISVVLLGSYVSRSQTLVNAFPNLSFSWPVFLTNAGDGTNRIFVVQQGGLIKVFQNDSTVSSSSTFLNISGKLWSTGGSEDERGLLGLAFHPHYSTNGYFYVNYTAGTPPRTVIARYSVMPGNADKADSLSEYKLLEISQPYSNHNGGMIFFGTDGYLYIGMGDGGSGDDPGHRAQNLDSLLGKILRINVDSTQGSLHYAVPPDNPLVGISGRDEIFAWGMRNPFRFSQDPVTGYILAGDVGQNAWEEIDHIKNGLNYGWGPYEGHHLNANYSGGLTGDTTGPIKEYGHGTDNCIIGGYIYRGYRRPTFVGQYVYAGHSTGKIWRMSYDGVTASPEVLITTASFEISSFGVDEHNELYLCNYSSPSGNIQRFSGPSLILATTTHVSPANGSLNLPTPLTLKWRQASGATKYCVEMSTNSGFTLLTVYDSTLTDTSYVPGSLSLGSQYYWRVRARNANGWGNYSAGWSFTTAAIPAPPLLASPSNGATNQALMPTLNWNSSAGATTYRLQVSTDSSFASTLFDDSTLTALSQQIGPLLNTTGYFWRVRGKNAAGTGSFSAIWKFTTTAAITVSYQVAASWGLLSIPLTVSDGRKNILFPTARSNAYTFVPITGYEQSDTLINGPGYFLKFDSTQNVNITGVPRHQDTIHVSPGWNLIGSISDPIDTSSIIQSPPGIIQSVYYGYAGAYSAADTIKPAKGYWVKANASGQLIFGSAAVSARSILPMKTNTIPTKGDAKNP